MGVELRRWHDFDLVFDTQAVFRKLLHALANPGCEENIMELAAKIRVPHPLMPALAAALLDNRTGFFAAGVDGALLHDFTLARETSIENADFAFIDTKMSSREITELVAKVRSGTLESPEFSCTLFVACDDAEETSVALAGPGIPGVRQVRLGRYAVQWLKAREAAGFLYPCGVDLFFVNAAGGVIAVPRLCRQAEGG
jgi:alpha-D-ribose 1-methylphosphonate 5-triphosphate synthase subunit PhnH